MKATHLIILPALIVSASMFSQKDYTFASTGAQKLLINPALAGNTPGLDVQTLCATNQSAMYYPFSSVYTGVSYGLKKFGVGLSNTYFLSETYYKYSANQTDLSLSYKIKAGSKITLVPSLQASYIERKQNYYYYLDYIIANPYRDNRQKKNVSFSTGILMDINKAVTFGAAFYNVNQPDIGLYGAGRLSLLQVYHASALLFKNKQITLQPYFVLSFQKAPSYQNYIEFGTYTMYKFLSLHVAVRNSDFFIAGLSASVKGFRLGYTLNHAGYSTTHELFLSANLFNKTKKAPRNLMLN